MSNSDELVKLLCSSEYFDMFVKRMINTISNNKLSFSEWNSMVVLYAKMNKVLPYNCLLKDLCVSLSKSDVIIKNDKEKSMYDKIINRLNQVCTSNISKDDLDMLKILESKVKRLSIYLNNKIITYSEWLMLYDDFLNSYDKLKFISDDVRLVLSKYISLLLYVNIKGINDLNKDDYYNKCNSLRLVL